MTMPPLLRPRDVDRAAPLLAALRRDGTVTVVSSWWKQTLLGVGSSVFLALGVFGLISSIRVMMGVQPAGIGRFGLEQSWLAGVLFFPLPVLLGLAGVVVVIVRVARPTRLTASTVGVEIARGRAVVVTMPWHLVTGIAVERSRFKLLVTTTVRVLWNRDGVPWATPVPAALSHAPRTAAAMLEAARQDAHAVAS